MGCVAITTLIRVAPVLNVGLIILHGTGLWSEPLCSCSLPAKKVDIEVNPLPSLCLAAWEAELGVDYDREFLLQGIKCGFDIIDESSKTALQGPIKRRYSSQTHPSCKAYDGA